MGKSDFYLFLKYFIPPEKETKFLEISVIDSILLIKN